VTNTWTLVWWYMLCITYCFILLGHWISFNFLNPSSWD
jgi:hypothetical protein